MSCVSPFVSPMWSEREEAVVGRTRAGPLSASLCHLSHAVVASWPRSVTGQQTIFVLVNLVDDKADECLGRQSRCK